MKLTGSRKIISGLALTVAVALTGVVGFAQQQGTAQDRGGRAGQEQGRHRGGKGEHGMRGGFGGRFAEKLNLTDAQKEQMKQIAARYRESTKALRQQLHTEGRRGGGDFGVANGGAFDEAAVRSAAQARANARVEMEVARARMMSEMYAVLTPEQKAQLATERQERRSRRGAESDTDDNR